MLSAGCAAYFAGGVALAPVTVVANSAAYKGKATLAGSLQAAVVASEQALQDLEYRKMLSQTKKDGVACTIYARTTSGTEVDIYITKVSDAETRVSIRAGVLGDRAISTMLLDRIKVHLQIEQAH